MRCDLSIDRLAPSAGILALLALPFTACKKDKEEPKPAATTNTLTLEVQTNGADSLPVAMRTKLYTNAAGNRYAVKLLRYYISNVRLLRADGTSWQEPKSYHLVRVEGAPADNPEIELRDVPFGDYTAVSFAMGVDSVANSRLDQVGDLNPTNDMVWDWNTGYIFLRMEGWQVQGAALNEATDPGIELAVGTNACYRPVTMAFPQAATVTATISPEVHLTAAFNSLFDGTPPLNFGGTYFVAANGDVHSRQMADNYARMFSVAHVHNE